MIHFWCLLRTSLRFWAYEACTSLLADLLGRFHLLKYSLVIILAFVGTKMLIEKMISHDHSVKAIVNVASFWGDRGHPGGRNHCLVHVSREASTRCQKVGR